MQSPSPEQPLLPESGPLEGGLLDPAASRASPVVTGGAGDRRFGGTRPFARRGRGIPPKLYRMGEVVDYSGVSRQTIHNYTTMGLLRERRWTPGGHRLYDVSVFERLDRIAALKAQNKSLRDIREHFARLDGG